MENLPPHLPRKTCDVKNHNRLKSVWWILFVVFVAALSSLALTLSTLVWLAPTFMPYQLISSTQRIFTSQSEELDISVLNKIKQNLWYIYDKREKVGGEFYNNDTLKIQAVMFSSDGWAIAYVPDYQKGLEKYWEAYDYQGVSYKIEKVFVDTLSDLAYIKFSGEGFSFVSFANWNEVLPGKTVWEIASSKREKYILDKPVKIKNDEKYFIWDPQFFYQLSEKAEVGSLVINSDGEMVGILDSNRNVIYGWMVDSQFAPVLQAGKTNYTAVPWKGSMVHGYVKENDIIRRVSGFYVESSPSRVSATTVASGDLILKIQNHLVEENDVSRQILLAPDPVTVTILRDGKEISVDVKKINIIK